MKSGQDIANETGIPKRTVHHIINTQIAQVCNSDERIQRIIANDMEAIENMSEIAKRFSQEAKTKEQLDKGEVETANNVIRESFKRSQIYQGRATDKHELSVKDMSQLTTAELLAYYKDIND